MRFLKTNTATRVTVGPCLDKTDGISPELALTVTNEKLTFVVDDGGVPTLVLDVAPTASGGANDMVHVTNDDAGFYDLELAAANVNYLGRAMLGLNDVATHLPVFHEFMILSAQAYDAMFGTGNFSSDAKAINGVATTSVTAVNANVGTTQPINFTGTGASAYAKSDVVDIAGAAVNTATAQVGANVVSQANIDFGATQKASIQTAADASLVAINLDHLAKTATAAADMTTEVSDNTILARILANGDTSAFDPATDGIQLIRDKLPTNLEDLAVTDTTGLVSVGTIGNGVITAAAIADAAIDNATFAADIGSTAFATNIMALAVFKALDSAITDAVSLTTGGLLEKVRRLTWIMSNKIEVSDSTGNTVIYKDDSTTEAYNVNAMLVDNSVTTTRLRAA